MKKRKKLGRKLLSWLLTLAMVIGMMPGMSLTTHAVENTVTWDSVIFDANPTGGTIDGITFTFKGGMSAKYTFTAPETSTFTKIVFTASKNPTADSGQVSVENNTADESFYSKKATWTGNAKTVVITVGSDGIGTAEFTLESSDTGLYTVKDDGSVSVGNLSTEQWRRLVDDNGNLTIDLSEVSGSNSVEMAASTAEKMMSALTVTDVEPRVIMWLKEDASGMTEAWYGMDMPAPLLNSGAKLRIDQLNLSVGSPSQGLSQAQAETLRLSSGGMKDAVAIDVSATAPGVDFSKLGDRKIRLYVNQPKAWDEAKTKGYYLREDGGTEEVPVTFENKGIAAGTGRYAKMELSHLSVYLLVQMADQNAPAKPTMASCTTDSITLEAITNGEYRCDNGEWQTSPVFTGLSADIEYTFYQRLKGDVSHNPSPASEGASFQVAHAHTHNGITFTAWTSNNSLPTAAGSYYLANDVTLGSLWNVPEGTTNLCLNGHAIKASGSHGMISVGTGITLNLYDEGEGEHKYTINNGLAVVNDNATGDAVKTFTGGYITGGYVEGQGAAVLVSSGGIFHMYGGTLIGNKAYGGWASFGGAVSVQAGHFEMHDGKIIGNYSMYGAVDTRNGGDGFIMRGGEISYNTATYQGGGVCMGGSGIATISGGKITNNTALGYGEGHSEAGGIVFRSGASKLNISGNPIIKDNAKGDVYLWSGKKLTITGEIGQEASIGITIAPASGNSGYASGVFTNSADTSFNVLGSFFSNSSNYAVGKNSDGQLFLGSPIVTLTYDGNGATGGNVPAETTGYASGSAITVPGNTNSLVKTGLVFDGWNTMADGSGTAYAADQAFTITANTTLYAQWKIVHVHDDISFTAWTATNSMPTEAGNYYLANDVTISSTWSVPSGTTNLCLNGHGIIMSGTNRVITVASGRTLNLYDCGTEAVHKFTVTNPSAGGAGLAKVNDGLESGYQTFTGGYITGGQGGQGGGVYIAGGTFNMHGGNIIGNHARGSMYYDGGGVALSENTNSRFVMTGGAIQYNTSVGRGGGVGIQKKATAELSGDAKITYNSCSDWGGGISSFGTLNISGNVKITNNKGGSALHPQQGSLTISGAPVIFDNEVTANVLPEVKINVIGTLTEGAKLGIYLGNGGVFTDSSDTTYNDASKFVSDNPNYSVMKNADEQLYLGTSYTVTFKVVNGSWDDETTTDKTVTLNGYEGDELKLTENQIPAVGSKPGATYKAEGSWNVTPNVDTVITAATTYVYTYEEKDTPSEAVAPYVTAWTSTSIYVEAVSGQEYVIVLKGQTPDWTEAVTTTAEYHEFESLTPATEYSIYTRIKETESAFASEAKKTDVLTSLNGWETLGEPKTGETITIIPDPEDAQGLTWQWYYAEENDQESVVKGEAIEGETSSSYVVKEGDVGKYLYYVISKGGKELENGYVGPVKITIHPTVSLEDWAYGENPNTPVVTGNTGNGSVSFTYVENGSEDPESETVPTMPGDYTVFAYVEESGDYAYGYAEAEFTITKATPTANDFNFTAPSDLDYDGHAKTATVTFNTQNDTLNGMGDVTVRYYSDANCTDQVESKNAGTYYVGITVAEGDNYNATTSVLHGDDWQFTIGKASVTAPTIASKTYNGEVQTADVQASNLYVVTTNAGGTNVGEYDVVLTLSDPTNYKWTESDEATKTLTFQITKAAAPTVTVPTPEAVTYDPTKTLANVALSAGWTWVTATTVPTVVNEGYAAALTVDDANYDYAGVEGYSAETHKVTRTVALTVNKADGTAATVNPANRTYDGTSKALASVTGEAVGGEMKYVLGENGTNVPTEGWGSSIPEATNAGTYYVWRKVVGDSNHNDSAPACITVTISKKATTITADAASKTYGDADPALTATVTGTVGNDTLNYSLNRAEGNNVGSYTITVTAPAADNPNYDVTTINGTFTINRKAATITANNASKTYGEEDPALTATVTGAAGSDTFNYTVNRVAGNNAGDYAINVTVNAADYPNYDITAVSGTFTVNRREVVISGIEAIDKNYDGKTDAELNFANVRIENVLSADEGKLSVTATGSFETAEIGKGKTVVISNLTLSGDAVNNYVLAANGQQATAKADVSEQTKKAEEGAFVAKVEDFIGAVVDVQGMTLENAKAICTSEELAAFGAGEKMELTLEVNTAGALLTDEVIELVTNAMHDQRGCTVNGVQYLDVSLYKKIGNAPEEKVEKLTSPLTIQVNAPESMKNTDSTYRRLFFIVKVHDGKATVIAQNHVPSVTFKTDEFSVYALCYTDVKIYVNNETKNAENTAAVVASPKTYGENNAELMLLLMGSAFAMAALAVKIYAFRKKEEE